MEILWVPEAGRVKFYFYNSANIGSNVKLLLSKIENAQGNRQNSYV